MAEGPRSGANDGAEGFTDVVAAYVVTVGAAPRSGGAGPDPERDRQLISVFRQAEPAMQRELNTRAEKLFGAAYGVRILPPAPHASIRSRVLLGVYYTVHAGALTIEALRRFSDDLETVIHAALDDANRDPRLQIEATVVLDLASVAPAAGEDEPEGTPWEHIAPVLAAVATGIGVLGFVTFVGGGVAWGRFHAAGLSAEDAVSILPTQSLAVIGAQTLVPALAGAALITAALFIVRTILSRPSKGTPSQEEKARRDGIRASSYAIFIGIAEVVLGIIAFESFGWSQFLIFFLVGAVMAALVAAIAFRTDRFPYLIAAVFFSLAIFYTGVKVAAAFDNTKVRPAAVIRENKKATIGFFIGEDASRVYVGRLNVTGTEGDIVDRRSRIIAIKKDQVTDISIGPPLEPVDAKTRAGELADEICEEQVPPKTTDAGGANAKQPAKGGKKAAKQKSAKGGRQQSAKGGKNNGGAAKGATAAPVRCWRKVAGS